MTSDMPIPFDPGLEVRKLIDGASDDSAQRDFEVARANLLRIAEMATEATQTLMEIAEQSQHPKAFEALARMIETGVQAQRELLELQQSIRKIAAASAAVGGQAKSVTNNLFIGSTAQLQRIIEDMRKKDGDSATTGDAAGE
jgi:hypothetical protein